MQYNGGRCSSAADRHSREDDTHHRRLARRRRIRSESKRVSHVSRPTQPTALRLGVGRKQGDTCSRLIRR